MEKHYAISFEVVKEGDPESPEECTTAVVRCLSCGNTPGEAAQKLAEFLREELVRQYTNNDTRRQKIQELMRTWRERKSQRPQILQWGIIYPVSVPKPKDIVEVPNTNGNYRARVPCMEAVA